MDFGLQPQDGPHAAPAVNRRAWLLATLAALLVLALFAAMLGGLVWLLVRAQESLPPPVPAAAAGPLD
jgi:hypothetical protein